MVSLQKNSIESSSVKSFEETYKVAYSHGLEAIYALETVDIRSVRPLQEISRTIPKKNKIPFPVYHEASSQLEFDFGDGLREWVEPFFLSEPIQVLGLAKAAEKALIDRGKIYLRDLMGFDLQSLIFSKGIGQGHLDEIQSKFHRYVEEKDTKRSFYIDFEGWIRSITASSLQRKKIFVCLEDYRLEMYISLTPTEKMEIRRLTEEKRQEWKGEAILELRSSLHAKEVIKRMKEICAAFIAPWLERRQGIASRSEIEERLERVSLQPDLTLTALQFFSDLYFEKTFPLTCDLIELDNELYGLPEIEMMYKIAISRAQTYFYKAGVQYGYQELISLISRECAKHWIGFPDQFLERIFRLSSAFFLDRDGAGRPVMLLSQ